MAVLAFVARIRSAVLAALVPGLLLAACGSARSATPVPRHPPPRATVAGGAPAHIAVILMENEEYGKVIGSGQAPYINALARRYATADEMFAITHPSLPNYLALTGGSTFGISRDCTDCSVRSTSLVDQLESRGLSWKAYMQSLPRPCFTGAGAGDYAKRHDPFLYYTRVAGDPTRCRRVVPLRQLYADERTGSLPRFLWISPNVCEDEHNCPLATGDRFLAGLVPSLLSALGPHGLLVLTWDEGSTDDGCCRLASGGHIATILAGGEARRGAQLRSATDHYSVLQAVEDLFGLPRLRAAACGCTPSLRPLLATPGGAGAGRPRGRRPASPPTPRPPPR